MTWQLADCKAGDGGFACVPAAQRPNSHARPACARPTSRWTWSTSPRSRRRCHLPYGRAKPTAPYPGKGGTAPLCLYKYSSRTATRGGVSIELAEPEVYWDEAIVEGMTPEQRAVMYGPCSSIAQKLHLQVDADGNVVLGK